MKYEKIIENIRLVVNSKPLSLTTDELNEFCELLIEQNCLWLVTKIKDANIYKMAAHAALLSRKTAVKEQFFQCVPLFSCLDTNRIPYAAVKGAILSYMAYDDYYSRTSADVDLLIQRKHIDTVKEFLKKTGFVQGKIQDQKIIPFTRSELVFHTSMTHQTAPFIIQTENKRCPFVIIDINFDVIWGENKNIEITSAFFDDPLESNNTVSMTIEGISFKKLAPVNEFIALCLHHYKDMNSIYLIYNGSLKLSLYLDIYNYIKQNKKTLDPFILQKASQEKGITAYVYYCIYYTKLIFSDQMLDDYIIALETEQGKRLINQYGLSDSEIGQWCFDFSERLFNLEFPKIFSQLLSPDNMKKIQTNQNMML